MTLIGLIYAILFVASCAVGALSGAAHYGVLGFIVGGLVGALVGHVGTFLLDRSIEFALRFTERFKSTQELRNVLKADFFAGWDFSLHELRRRGEDISSETSRVIMLLSRSPDEDRLLGWLLIRKYYPAVAKELSDFNPKDEAQVCRGKVEKLSSRA